MTVAFAICVSRPPQNTRALIALHRTDECISKWHGFASERLCCCINWAFGTKKSSIWNLHDEQIVQQNFGYESEISLERQLKKTRGTLSSCSFHHIYLVFCHSVALCVKGIGSSDYTNVALRRRFAATWNFEKTHWDWLTFRSKMYVVPKDITLLEQGALFYSIRELDHHGSALVYYWNLIYRKLCTPTVISSTTSCQVVNNNWNCFDE